MSEPERGEAAVAGFGVAPAVTGAGGQLVAFERADGVPFPVSEVAIDKAWTVASFRLATHPAPAFAAAAESGTTAEFFGGDQREYVFDAAVPLSDCRIGGSRGSPNVSYRSSTPFG